MKCGHFLVPVGFFILASCNISAVKKNEVVYTHHFELHLQSLGITGWPAVVRCPLHITGRNLFPSMSTYWKLSLNKAQKLLQVSILVVPSTRSMTTVSILGFWRLALPSRIWNIQFRHLFQPTLALSLQIGYDLMAWASHLNSWCISRCRSHSWTMKVSIRSSRQGNQSGISR